MYSPAWSSLPSSPGYLKLIWRDAHESDHEVGCEYKKISQAGGKMIGQIVRTKKFEEYPKTKSEVKLGLLRDTVEAWERLRLGIDEHPARAGTRLETGEEITKFKRHLIETGLYRTVL